MEAHYKYINWKNITRHTWAKSRWTLNTSLNGSALQVYAQITVVSYILSSSIYAQQACTSIYM